MAKPGSIRWQLMIVVAEIKAAARLSKCTEFL
jgi:hypothetical protein